MEEEAAADGAGDALVGAGDLGEGGAVFVGARGHGVDEVHAAVEEVVEHFLAALGGRGRGRHRTESELLLGVGSSGSTGGGRLRRPSPNPLPGGEGFGGLGVDDHVVLVDGDGEGFGDVGTLDEGGAGFDFYFVGLDPAVVGVAPALAGADVVFPVVPGAFEHLAGSAVVEAAGFRGGHEAGDLAEAELAALVWAAVEEGEVFA
jgi:hypothetical protein